MSLQASRKGDPSGVTVIITVFQRRHFLPRAIRSALEQSYPPREVLVVDDGSSADLRPVLAEFADAVRVLRKPHGGPASARNAGLERASGELVLFLDDDDFLEPSALKTLAGALARCPGAAWAAGRFSYVDAAGKRLQYEHSCRYDSGDLYAGMIRENLLGPPSVVLSRAEAVRAAGGFPEGREYLFAEDYDLWLSMARDHPLIAVREKVSNYRRHHAQATESQWALHYESHLRVLERQRGRARPGFAADFEQAILRTRLGYGDSLYVMGRHREARVQWRKVLAARDGLDRRLLVGRWIRSYLPAPLLHRLRALGGGRLPDRLPVRFREKTGTPLRGTPDADRRA